MFGLLSKCFGWILLINTLMNLLAVKKYKRLQNNNRHFAAYVFQSIFQQHLIIVLLLVMDVYTCLI